MDFFLFFSYAGEELKTSLILAALRSPPVLLLLLGCQIARSEPAPDRGGLELIQLALLLENLEQLLAQRLAGVIAAATVQHGADHHHQPVVQSVHHRGFTDNTGNNFVRQLACQVSIHIVSLVFLLR